MNSAPQSQGMYVCMHMNVHNIFFCYNIPIQTSPAMLLFINKYPPECTGVSIRLSCFVTIYLHALCPVRLHKARKSRTHEV